MEMHHIIYQDSIEPKNEYMKQQKRNWYDEEKNLIGCGISFHRLNDYDIVKMLDIMQLKICEKLRLIIMIKY